MWKILLNFICISFALCSCNQQSEAYAPPVFSTIEEIHSYRLSDELIIGYPMDMFVNESYVFILALADNTWLQVYDKNTGEHIGGFVPKGQGPGEVVTGTTCSYDEEKYIISIFDETSMKLLTYHFNDDIKKSFTFIDEKAFYNCGASVRRVWPLKKDLFFIDGQLGTASEQQKRFQLMLDTEVINEYNDFPVSSYTERLVFMSPTISISPDRQKMAVGTLYGGILELFDLSGNIELRTLEKFYPPIIQCLSGAIQNTEETIWGFSTLCTTDDKIYSVLIGDKNPNLFNNISVFDWKGRPLIKYKTDCLVLKLCASPKEPGKLYGLAFSENKEFYLVSLIV